MKIIITGFDPFGGETINPAYEAVKLLPSKIGSAEVITAELPTVFGKCAVVLEQLIELHSPDAVICVGQAGGSRGIAIERIAINIADANISDNEGNQPADLAIIEGGVAAYFSNLPVKDMMKNIKNHEIPASISNSAGTFVCNDVMYRLLHMSATKYPNMRGGFIHVPYIPEQVEGKPDGTPSMPLDVIAKGLEYAIEIVSSG